MRGITLTGIFAIPFIPLVVSNELFFPFITGKNFAFRILVEITAVSWLVLALTSEQYRPRRGWVVAAFALFVAVIGFADLLAMNPFKAFWSNFERMEGWVTLAHLLAYLTVLLSVVKTETLWRRLLHTSVGVSVLAALYGVLQLVGFITINQGGVRLDATFGNATYLAVYMVFHAFITAFLWERAWREQGGRLSVSLMYGVIMALQLFILFFTATRGAILGLIGGALLSALLLVFTSRDSRNAWRVSVGVIAGIAVATGLFFAFKNTSVVQSIEPLKRLADISLTERTVESRFLNYQMAWEGVKERPFLGWGQEGYNFVFNKYYDPRMYAQEPWFDRVHNIIFDWLIAGGFLGLFAYLSIFAAALWGLWFSGAFSIAERSIFTGLLAAYTFNNLFVFDNVTSYMMFVIVLAYIGYRVAESKDARVLWRWSVPRRFVPVVSVVAIALLWGVAWGVNAAPLAQNRELIRALKFEGGVPGMTTSFENAAAYGVLGTQEVREQLIQIAARVASSQNISPEEKGALVELAEQQMIAHMEEVPGDARFPLFLGMLYQSYGQYEKAREALAQARALSPGKQFILMQEGRLALTVGDVAGGLALLKEAHELAPEYAEARVVYAAALIQTGAIEEGLALVQSLAEQGETPDQRVIGVLAQRGAYAEIARLWEARVAVHPDDVQARLSIAASHFAAGDKQTAIQVLEQIASDFPAVASQAQALIQQIKDGTATLSQ